MKSTKPSTGNRSRRSKSGVLFVGAIILCGAWSPPVLSQTEPDPQPQPFAGLTIVGEIGKVYSIEYIGELAPTIDANDWRCLEFLQLPTSPYLWIDKSALTAERRFYRAVEFAASTNMVFVPPGAFLMGSPESEVDRYYNEGPQTAVTIGHGFWMGKTEVTQAEYEALMGDNPSFFNGIRDWPVLGTDFGVDLRRPVEQVTRNNATNYCVVLTHQDRAAGRIPAGSEYRLPTEAEWEYACRAWTSTRFSHGDDPGYTTETGETVGYTNLTNYAWYRDNSSNQTHPVGQKLPNPWGLYDMHGNVSEWCQDWYSDRLPGGITLDPQGPGIPLGIEKYRVFRGANWYSRARECRSARRQGDYPGLMGSRNGFRVILAPARP